LKFSGQGTCIKIEVKELSQELEIRVIDQGRGVPKEKLQSIFGRFEQVEHADGTNNSGAGLGLAICKKIIEGHNGVIGVDSSEGSGSAFWIRLPMM
jgi:signal transduction histidine kinase